MVVVAAKFFADSAQGPWWPASAPQMRTVSISSFAQRHSAFHWYAGFDEAYNVGKFGLETADEVYAIAEDWLQRKGKEDDWFLHVHMWDPTRHIVRLLI